VTFEEIADETLAKADDIKCSIHEYRDGLGVIIEQLRSAIEAAG
jgi:hypothetical protein